MSLAHAIVSALPQTRSKRSRTIRQGAMMRATTLGRRDAAVERTWMYSPRVVVRVMARCPARIA
jgi:hypothetical protein